MNYGYIVRKIWRKYFGQKFENVLKTFSQIKRGDGQKVGFNNWFFRIYRK